MRERGPDQRIAQVMRVARPRRDLAVLDDAHLVEARWIDRAIGTEPRLRLRGLDEPDADGLELGAKTVIERCDARPVCLVHEPRDEIREAREARPRQARWVPHGRRSDHRGEPSLSSLSWRLTTCRRVRKPHPLPRELERP